MLGSERRGQPGKVLGMDTVIAFYSADLPSQTFKRDGDWQKMQEKGGVASSSINHQKFLRKSVDEASDVLARMAPGDNPVPLIDIDEFGWDYDGGIDQHTANVLLATHAKRPDLNIAVWQMRGPVAPKLAAVYRKTVALVMMENYYNLVDAWTFAFQLQVAQLNGLVDRSVIAIGLGSEADELGGWEWTRTAEELEQQIQLIRMVAPQSPGLAFFGSWIEGDRGMRMTKEQLDEICGRFGQYPTDGSGLKPELLKLGKLFTKRYKGPAVFASSNYVYPYFHSGHDGGEWGSVHQPEVARVLMMNLGKKDAKGMHVRLRQGDRGVWAEGTVDIPARSVVVALLPIAEGKGFWGWGGTGEMEIDAPAGCEVFTFFNSRHHGTKNAQ